MKKQTVGIAVALAALVGGAGYGGLVWWPQHQAKAAQAQADVLLGYLRKTTADLNPGTPQYVDGKVVFQPLTLTLPRAGEQPVQVTVDKLIVAPDGSAEIVSARFSMATPDGPLTLGAENGTLSAFKIMDGVPLHLAGDIERPFVAGPSVDKLKRQRAVVDMLLANAPAAVQAIPDQVLTSLSNLTLSADLQFDPEREHLQYAGVYDFPGLARFAINFASGGITLDAMKSINILHDPALKPLENPALAELSKGAALSFLARQGDLETLSLTLADQGIVNSILQIYGSLTKTAEAEARTKLIEIITQYPVQSRGDEALNPQAEQVVADARSALATLIKGDATAIVVEARPRDRAQVEATKHTLTTFNETATAFDIDVSARR